MHKHLLALTLILLLTVTGAGSLLAQDGGPNTIPLALNGYDYTDEGYADAVAGFDPAEPDLLALYEYLITIDASASWMLADANDEAWVAKAAELDAALPLVAAENTNDPSAAESWADLAVSLDGQYTMNAEIVILETDEAKIREAGYPTITTFRGIQPASVAGVDDLTCEVVQAEVDEQTQMYAEEEGFFPGFTIEFSSFPVGDEGLCALRMDWIIDVQAQIEYDAASFPEQIFEGVALPAELRLVEVMLPLDATTVTSWGFILSGAQMETLDVNALVQTVAIVPGNPIPLNLVQTADLTRDNDVRVFTDLVAAIDAAGLTETLTGAGEFTLFAPTNRAFNATLSELGLEPGDLDEEQLAEILSYHVVEGMVAELEPGQTLTTVQGAAITVGEDGTLTDASGLELPPVAVEEVYTATPAGGAISNGMIYQIDGVLLPADPRPTLADVVSTTDDFSTLLAAAEAAGLVDALAGEGPLTVFAPTNDAFDAALEELGIDLETLVANTDLLTQIVSYHVVPGVALEITEETTSTITLLDGAEITIAVTEDGIVLTDALERPVTATLVETAISNGVVYAIDNVLLPADPGAALVEPAPEQGDQQEVQQGDQQEVQQGDQQEVQQADESQAEEQQADEPQDGDQQQDGTADDASGSSE
ncbi:MAG: fasciclin domain-containing protein [Chloroflexi bacterium]|nr:fasciclin domain-containing protein [Chloroflexota bacterium]